MEVARRRFADVVVVAPIGRLDHGNADELERVLRPLAEPSGDAAAGLVLDFGRVDYVSSVGLRVLMIAAKEMRRRGARIDRKSLRCGDEPVRCGYRQRCDLGGAEPRKRLPV